MGNTKITNTARIEAAKQIMVTQIQLLRIVTLALQNNVGQAETAVNKVRKTLNQIKTIKDISTIVMCSYAAIILTILGVIIYKNIKKRKHQNRIKRCDYHT